MKRILIILLSLIYINCSSQVIGRHSFYRPLTIVEVAPPDSFVFTSVQPASIEQVEISYRAHSQSPIYLNWGNGTIVTLTADALQHTITSNYSTANTTYYPRFTGNIAGIYDIRAYYQGTVSFDFDEFAKLTGLRYFNNDGSNSTSTGSLANLPSSLEWLILGTNPTATVTGDLDNFPNGLRYFETGQLAGLDGTFADLPDSLEYCNMFQMNGFTAALSMNDLSTKTKLRYMRCYVPTLTGSINNLPKGLIVAEMFSNNDAAITGSIDNLSKSLESLTLYGPQITGDVRNLSGELRTVNLEGTNVTATAGTYPRWSNTVINFQCGWTATEVDAFLNGWATTCGLGTAARTISLAGDNAARTSASDAAYTDMDVNKNKTFVMTP